jgi:hypothetical protein
LVLAPFASDRKPLSVVGLKLPPRRARWKQRMASHPLFRCASGARSEVGAQTVKYNVLILGASYGSLFSTKVLMADGSRETVFPASSDFLTNAIDRHSQRFCRVSPSHCCCMVFRTHPQAKFLAAWLL